MLYNVMLVENMIVWRMNGETMLLGYSEIKAGRLMDAESFARNAKSAGKKKGWKVGQDAKAD
jgi:hypothetical protein